MTNRKISEMSPEDVAWWIREALDGIRPERRQQYVEAIQQVLTEARDGE